jgi:hypothetical protein
MSYTWILPAGRAVAPGKLDFKLKLLGISWVAEQLLASQEGLGSMELGSYIWNGNGSEQVEND